MLSAAYGLLGLSLRERELVLPSDPGRPRGRLALRRLSWRGRVLFEADRVSLDRSAGVAAARAGTLSSDRSGS
jgi:hypothetical protein